MDDPGEYDTFKDLYFTNPQKRIQVLAFLSRIGMTSEEAERAIDEYVATQKGETQ